jgi:hypothetical protein
MAGKWSLEGLKILLSTDNKEEEEIPLIDHNRSFYHIDILRNALNLALDSNINKSIETKDIKVLDLLLEQIRIQFTVDTSKR